MHELDALAKQFPLKEQLNELLDDDSVATAGLNVTPSARAMVLTDYGSRQEQKDDVLLRAHAIDHALLTTHIEMLGRK
jgi:hypothetical protein